MVKHSVHDIFIRTFLAFEVVAGGRYEIVCSGPTSGNAPGDLSVKVFKKPNLSTPIAEKLVCALPELWQEGG